MNELLACWGVEELLAIGRMKVVEDILLQEVVPE